MTRAADTAGTDPAPGRRAALLARDAIEGVLFSISQIPVEMDRAGVADRLRRAIQCAYAVLDSDVLAPAHHDGLTECAALVREARAMLASAGDRRTLPALASALDGLELARSALALGLTAVAQIQLERRAELHAGRRAPEAPAAGRPFRASLGQPELHAFARRPLAPEVALDPVAPPPRPPARSKKLAAPKSLEALQAFAEAARSGALEQRFAAEAEPPPELQAEPLAFAYEPAIEEVEMLRRVARDCLEDVAIHRDLRKPNAIEGWTDQAPFEQRLLDCLDGFASYGGVGLPLVSLYVAEAKAPDAGRAFAAALVLGSIEGRDTVDAAIAMLKQSAPEAFPGWIEGLSLAPHPAIDDAMIELAAGSRPALAGVALEVLGARRAAPFERARDLARSGPREAAVPAARALATAGSHDEAVAALEELLATTGDDEVFAAAAEAAMRRGHAPARKLVRAAMTDPARPARADAAAFLLCLGGHPTDLDALLARFDAAPSGRLLRGLGRFGHTGALDLLAAQLSSSDDAIVEAAAEALERITGAGLREKVEEPWDIELPPEAAGAGGLPVPTREVEKVVSDPARWRAWLDEHAARFDRDLRTRGGAPWTPIALVDELESRATPPDRRPEAALELWITTGLVSPFSPDDWVARQRAHLAELRARVRSAAVEPGAWAFGAARAAERDEPRPRPSRVLERGTIAFSLSAELASLGAGALPFAGGAPAGGRPPLAPRSTAPEPSPAGARTAGHDRGSPAEEPITAIGPSEIGGAGRVLPFAPAAAPIEPPGADEPTRPQLAVLPPDGAPPFRGPALAPPEPARPFAEPRAFEADPPTLPPQPALAVRPAVPFAEALPLEPYAALCAELDADPRREAEILARHGLTREARAALDAAHRRAMAVDPRAGQRFAFAYAAAKNAIAARPPRGT
jgi:hypothetical protein